MNKQEVIELLDEQRVMYTLIEHPAVYTVEEIDALKLPHSTMVVKNLFLRDDKKKNYYLLVAGKDKKINLKELRDVIPSRPLSFGSEDDLMAYLNLTKGSVTPLGVLNDVGRSVHVLVDSEVMDYEVMGIHPNENTATVWLSPQDLKRIVEWHGNSFCSLDI